MRTDQILAKFQQHFASIWLNVLNLANMDSGKKNILAKFGQIWPESSEGTEGGCAAALWTQVLKNVMKLQRVPADVLNSAWNACRVGDDARDPENSDADSVSDLQNSQKQNAAVLLAMRHRLLSF